MKSLLSFILGLVVGAAILFGAEHRDLLTGLFPSSEEAIQTKVAGAWQGSVDVGGRDIDFSMALKKNGHDLSGVVSNPQVGDLPCQNLAIDPAGNISFSVQVEDKSANFKGKFDPATSSMKGAITGDFDGGSWSAAKSKS
jgi:hypothetical protein